MRFGTLLIIIGMLMTIGGFIFPFATVEYEATTFSLYVSFPSGSQASPTSLVAGTLVDILATVETDLGTPSVSVSIHNGGHSESLSLTIESQFTEGDVTYYDMAYRNWKVPSLADGTLLTFEFTAYVGDEWTSKTTYGSISEVNGDFYINGELATTTSVHKVTSPTLTIEFKATSGGALIERVYVDIYEMTDAGDVFLELVDLSEVAADQNWQTTYTLPREGKYRLNGYFKVGTTFFQGMSVIGNFGEKTSAVGFKLSNLTIIGLATTGLGVIINYTQQPKRRRR